MLGLGYEQVEKVVGEWVTRWVAADDVDVAFECGDALAHHELAQEGGRQTKSRRPWVQAGPPRAVFVCDQKELVSQHCRHPFEHVSFGGARQCRVVAVLPGSALWISVVRLAAMAAHAAGDTPHLCAWCSLVCRALDVTSIMYPSPGVTQ